MMDDYFSEYGFTGPDDMNDVQALYDENVDKPLIDRMRTAILLQNSAVKALINMHTALDAHVAEHHQVIQEQAQRIVDADKRIEFLEEMLLTPKEKEEES